MVRFAISRIAPRRSAARTFPLASLACGALIGGLAGVLAGALPTAARADDAPLPKSLSEAIRMERADALPRTAFYETPGLGRSQPGDLLRQEAAHDYDLPRGASAVRILYRSENSSGAPVATSAVVLIPAGTAPAGGWPVIAWAHGTSGVARQCAPSLMKDMLYGEEGLMPMVRAGFAVVATDYHGLGTVGPHQYVNKIAQARDVLYSVPAARAAVPALGQRWVAIGHSQGGLAAWGLAELQATIKDPNYLGAVSVAGAADLYSILKGMGEANSEATYYLTYMAYAIHARSPSFEPAQMITGAALKRFHDATTKGCWNYAYASFLDAPHERTLKEGWDTIPAVKEFFASNELGSRPVGGPLFVIGGEADMTVPFAQLKAAAVKACHNGVALTFRGYAGLDHDPTMDKSTPDQLAWVRDRFAGKPAEDSCPTLR